MNGGGTAGRGTEGLTAHLAREDGLRRRRGVDAGGLDGDDKVAAVLQEVLRVDAHNACLVRLRHICASHTDLSAVLTTLSDMLLSSAIACTGGRQTVEKACAG